MACMMWGVLIGTDDDTCVTCALLMQWIGSFLKLQRCELQSYCHLWASNERGLGWVFCEEEARRGKLAGIEVGRGQEIIENWYDSIDWCIHAPSSRCS